MLSYDIIYVGRDGWQSLDGDVEINYEEEESVKLISRNI